MGTGCVAVALCIGAYACSEEMQKKEDGGTLEGGSNIDAGAILDSGKVPDTGARHVDGGCDACVDTGMVQDSGGGDVGAETEAADGGYDAGVRPQTPAAPAATRVFDAPCAFPASLSHDPKSDTLLATCGGTPSALFRSPPISGGAGQWTKMGEVQGYPSHHIQLSDRFFSVNHAMPDGFTIIDGNAGAASQTVLFADLALTGADGKPLPFAPNNPAGSVLAGGLLCVATSNMDHIDADPAKTTYHMGTVQCLPWRSDGTVGVSAATVNFTSGLNPTGMTLLDSDIFAVLSSNNYAPAVRPPNREEAALDVYEAPSMSHTTIKLGTITAQISPQLTIASGGLVLFGVQKPASALMGVDIARGETALDRRLSGVKNFIASVAAWKSVAAVSDFGVFGEGGRVLFVDTAPQGWEGVPETALYGSGGPSVVVGEKLYEAVTSNDGTSGSIWRMDLSTLK